MYKCSYNYYICWFGFNILHCDYEQKRLIDSVLTNEKNLLLLNKRVQSLFAWLFPVFCSMIRIWARILKHVMTFFSYYLLQMNRRIMFAYNVLWTSVSFWFVLFCLTQTRVGGNTDSCATNPKKAMKLTLIKNISEYIELFWIEYKQVQLYFRTTV